MLSSTLTLTENQKIKKSVAVWLICIDGKYAQKVLLQKRAGTEVVHGVKRLQFAPGICQSTWNEKSEKGEEVADTITRGAREELGKKFADSFDFSTLQLFDTNEYSFRGKKFVSYDFWGTITEPQLALVKLHASAKPRFITVGVGNIKTVKSNHETGANPEKDIVLFYNQYQTLKRLFALKGIFDNDK